MVALSSATLKGVNQSTSVALGTHLRNCINVKGFGAVGDGVSDDTVYIQNAINWVTGTTNKGIIFFPPGTYRVTSSLDFSYDGSYSVLVMGCGGASTITGDFADYIIKRYISPQHITGLSRSICRLNIVNTNSSGGGIIWRSVIEGVISDCTITAAKALVVENMQSYHISNCHMTPGIITGTTTGMSLSDNCVVSGCSVEGFDTGIRLVNLAQSIVGCRINGNNVGIRAGLDITGATFAANDATIMGCSFDGNGIAIYHEQGSSHAHYAGNYITASNGQTSPDGNAPQYGIRSPSDKSQFSNFSGIVIDGDFAVNAFLLTGAGGTTNRKGLVLNGVKAHNTNGSGGTDWVKPSTAHTAIMHNCNTTLTYLQSGLDATKSFDGDTYSVTNSSVATWGTTVSSGASGTNHTKVRYNGTNWTVVGI